MIFSEVYVNVPLLRDPELIDKDHVIWLWLWSQVAQDARRWEKKDSFVTVKGSCSPTMKFIAGKARCSVDSVLRSISRLEATGHLIREKHFCEDGGQTSNDYTLIARIPESALTPQKAEETDF